ncbi:transposase [Streptomyces prasinus]|uniref:transposase n=1 Tax=Streptomyces prasinus TaxID=67345 RepID=UPI00244DEA5A|nr:transposase [Streptomyces prasinus]
MSQRKPYPNDPSDARRGLAKPTLTEWRKARLGRRPTGQPAKGELRDVFNAILHVNPTGISWKDLPTSESTSKWSTGTLEFAASMSSEDTGYWVLGTGT